MWAINLKQRVEKPPKKAQRTLRLVLDQLSSSLFAKFFAACTIVLLISFTILSAALVVFSIRYSASQKHQLYSQNAHFIAQLAQGYNAAGPAGNRQLGNLIALSSQMIDADIYLVDTGGGMVAGHMKSSDHSDIAALDLTIPSSVIRQVVSGGSDFYEQSGTLGGFYNRSYLTVGTPVVDSNGQTIGAVFVSSRTDSILGYMRDIFRVFLFCVLAVLLFAFAAIYYVTRRLVRPLRQMAGAARSFARGDFNTRVPVGEPDEIGQLAVAFNNMAASLVSLEEMRRSFVANVSHELRTPMTSIAGFIDGILDGTIPHEKQEYYLQIVSDEVKRLSRLVYSLLNIARIEAGEVRIQQSRFDVAETIRRVMVGFEYAIDKKHLTVEGMDDLAERQLMVMADPDVTHQILFNLVENAVKFSNEGGALSITTASRGHRVYVSVKNTGIGIPAQELPHVFERFYKTDKSRSTDKKGVGLGLYIVRSMLLLQGQDITVKSVEGQYCEFVFTLASA